MNTETRKTLIPALVIVAAIFFATGLAGHLIHKLDLATTLLLMFGFAVFSTGVTWLTVWDDRQTRKREIAVTERLAPFAMELCKHKDGFYTISSDGPSDNFIVAEELDLDQLEAWIQGLQTGIGLEEAKYYDAEMGAPIARQEDRAHIGVGGEYIIVHIPGLEELRMGLLWGRMYKP